MLFGSRTVGGFTHTHWVKDHALLACITWDMNGRMLPLLEVLLSLLVPHDAASCSLECMMAHGVSGSYDAQDALPA